MKQLFTIDLKDYNPDGEKFYRPSVRGIILDDENKVAMIYSRKYHFYKFPGGGVEGDETHIETLAREIKEETGMTLIPESVREFGEVLKIQNGGKAKGITTSQDDKEKARDIVHIQQNFYYTCRVEDEIGEQDLDEDEKGLDFVLKFVPIDEAIRANDEFDSDDLFKKQMAEREKRVLELVRDSL